MTQYNTLNVKLSHSQLNKLKSAIKNGTEVNLNVSSNLIGNSINQIQLSKMIQSGRVIRDIPILEIFF